MNSSFAPLSDYLVQHLPSRFFNDATKTMDNLNTNTILNDKRFTSKKRVADVMLPELITRQLVDSIIGGAPANGLPLMVFELFYARQLPLFTRQWYQIKTNPYDDM